MGTTAPRHAVGPCCAIVAEMWSMAPVAVGRPAPETAGGARGSAPRCPICGAVRVRATCTGQHLSGAGPPRASNMPRPARRPAARIARWHAPPTRPCAAIVEACEPSHTEPRCQTQSWAARGRHMHVTSATSGMQRGAWRRRCGSPGGARLAGALGAAFRLCLPGCRQLHLVTAHPRL